MSNSGPTSRTSTGLETRRASVIHNSSGSKDGTLDDEQPNTIRPMPRSTLSRHFTTLREHAEAFQPTILEGDSSSERVPEGRREGFTLDMPPPDDARGVLETSELAAHPTKASTYDARGELVRHRDGSSASTEMVKRSTWPWVHATSPPSDEGMKRQNTFSSSDSVDKGARRHAPDLRMFGAPNGTLVGKESNQPQQAPKLTKAGRVLSIIIPPAKKKSMSDERASKRAQMAEESPNRSDAPKSGLKDRRKLNQIESMKLTLPLVLPELPSRSRTPIFEDFATAAFRGMAPPRQRSPKTPWATDTKAGWVTTDLPTAPPTVFEDPLENATNDVGHDLLFDSDPLHSFVTPINERPEKPLRKSCSRPRFGRGRSHKSEKSGSSLVKPPDDSNSPAVDETETGEQLEQLGKRSRRWRWSGPWTSSDVATPDSPAHEPSRNPCFRSRIWNPLKRRVSHPPPPTSHSTAAPDPNTPLIFRRKPSNSQPVKSLAALPLPPIFIPPEVVRVPTPPMFDDHGEVREGLSKFYFDMHDGKRPRPSPGRLWDSDAILMSQPSNITPPSSDSEESPQGVSSRPSPPPPDHPLTPVSPAYMHPTSLDWFRPSGDDRRNSKKSKEVREAEEMAKFEWLIPEHYPNSPLCPLHPKYRGASKGLCYYHGGLRAAFGTSESGSTPTSEQVEAPIVRKRRLVSLSSP